LVGIALAVGASVRLSQEMMFALAGAGAMTVGFALKDLAASVLAGLMIIIDRPFQVGDRVSFGGHYGEIISIGLRSVRLNTLGDDVVTIPNNKFLTDAVSSGNWGALDMMVTMDFFIGADQDLARARALVEECITSSRYAFLRKPWRINVNQVVEGNYFAIRLRARVYVLDCQYEKALETDVTERVIEAFREHGILPPAVLHRPADPEDTRAAAARAH
jgi:small-conductance mechanosensitive channel